MHSLGTNGDLIMAEQCRALLPAHWENAGASDGRCGTPLDEQGRCVNARHHVSEPERPSADTGVVDSPWVLDLRRAMHPFPVSALSYYCQMCGDPATHKVGEQHDLPFQKLTSWLCCWHFPAVMGTSCDDYPYECFAPRVTEVDYTENYPTETEQS